MQQNLFEKLCSPATASSAASPSHLHSIAELRTPRSWTAGAESLLLIGYKLASIYYGLNKKKKVVTRSASFLQTRHIKTKYNSLPVVNTKLSCSLFRVQSDVTARVKVVCVCVSCSSGSSAEVGLRGPALNTNTPLLWLQPAVQVCRSLIVKGHTFFPVTRTTWNAACVADNAQSDDDDDDNSRWGGLLIDPRGGTVFTVCVLQLRIALWWFSTCRGNANRDNHSLPLMVKKLHQIQMKMTNLNLLYSREAPEKKRKKRRKVFLHLRSRLDTNTEKLHRLLKGTERFIWHLSRAQAACQGVHQVLLLGPCGGDPKLFAGLLQHRHRQLSQSSVLQVSPQLVFWHLHFGLLVGSASAISWNL